MDKIWVKDVKEGERVKSLFLVARKATPTAKSGKTYLAAVFQDRTGELEARAFDRLDELGAFEVGDLIEVEGPVGVFQGRPQLRIEALAKVDPAAHDAAEFTFVPPPSRGSPSPRPSPTTPPGRSCSSCSTRSSIRTSRGSSRPSWATRTSRPACGAPRRRRRSTTPTRAGSSSTPSAPSSSPTGSPITTPRSIATSWSPAPSCTTSARSGSWPATGTPSTPTRGSSWATW